MKINEKIFMTREELIEEGPITIVAFGDSVTHGALAGDEIHYETTYWNLLRKKIMGIRNYIPINVINAGIIGAGAKDSLLRMDKQVLRHKPDLVIVCFGLNDVNGTLEEYLTSLETIFEKCRQCGAEVVFMTPNMMNTYVADDAPQDCLDYAKIAADYQNGGRMDLYIYSAKELAEKMDVLVCDCYSKWKELSKIKDVTMLLSNRINHPVKEMHELFADMLFETIFGSEFEKMHRSV